MIARGRLLEPHYEILGCVWSVNGHNCALSLRNRSLDAAASDGTVYHLRLPRSGIQARPTRRSDWNTFSAEAGFSSAGSPGWGVRVQTHGVRIAALWAVGLGMPQFCTGFSSLPCRASPRGPLRVAAGFLGVSRHEEPGRECEGVKSPPLEPHHRRLPHFAAFWY